MPWYDYSEHGFYFVTINTSHYEKIFGSICNQKMVLDDYGWIVEKTWDDLPYHYSNLRLDEFIVMPNHIHGIIEIRSADDFASHDSVRAGLRPAHIDYAYAEREPCDRNHSKWSGHRPARTGKYALSEIIRGFKSYSARKINILRGSEGFPVWHRNYYEHIIRSQKDLDRVREYIQKNPENWKMA